MVTKFSHQSTFRRRAAKVQAPFLPFSMCHYAVGVINYAFYTNSMFI